MIQLLRVILVKRYDSTTWILGNLLSTIPWCELPARPDMFFFSPISLTVTAGFYIIVCPFYCASYDQHQQSVITKNQLAAIRELTGRWDCLRYFHVQGIKWQPSPKLPGAKDGASVC